MRTKRGLYLGVAAIALAVAFGVAPTPASAQQGAAAVNIGTTDIGGVVSGPKGPEAGVWVIAETSDLPSKMSKIVVTDDQGRYVIPDLPKANYTVWARGYGLVDFREDPKRAGQDRQHHGDPGPHRSGGRPVLSRDLLVLDAEDPGQERCSRAPGRTATAWRPPSRARCSGSIRSRPMAASPVISSATRPRATIPKELGSFKNSTEAWERRIQSGQAMTNMAAALGRQDPKIAIANLADWTDRIAGRRAAVRQAAAAPRRRAQRRGHAVGLGDPQDLPA